MNDPRIFPAKPRKPGRVRAKLAAVTWRVTFVAERVAGGLSKVVHVPQMQSRQLSTRAVPPPHGVSAA